MSGRLYLPSPWFSMVATQVKICSSHGRSIRSLINMSRVLVRSAGSSFFSFLFFFGFYESPIIADLNRQAKRAELDSTWFIGFYRDLMNRTVAVIFLFLSFLRLCLCVCVVIFNTIRWIVLTFFSTPHRQSPSVRGGRMEDWGGWLRKSQRN